MCIARLFLLFLMIGCPLAWAENPPGVYELATYCHSIRQPCGVEISQKTPQDSDEFIAKIWKVDLSQTKIIKISKSKFQHLDRIFHLKHLWKVFEKETYPQDKLPKNDGLVLLNTTTSKGKHHILVPRYSKNLTPIQKLVLDWEFFLKAQVMQVNSRAFKKDF